MQQPIGLFVLSLEKLASTKGLPSSSHVIMTNLLAC